MEKLIRAEDETKRGEVVGVLYRPPLLQQWWKLQHSSLYVCGLRMEITGACMPIAIALFTVMMEFRWKCQQIRHCAPVVQSLQGKSYRLQATSSPMSVLDYNRTNDIKIVFFCYPFCKNAYLRIIVKISKTKQNKKPWTYIQKYKDSFSQVNHFIWALNTHLWKLAPV